MESSIIDWGVYARFYTVGEAEALILLLKSNNIPVTITREVNQLDEVILGSGMDPMISISVPADRFSEVNRLVVNSLSKIEGQSEIFTGELDILKRELPPERLDTQWIIMGYVLSLFAGVGIFVGLTLMHSTRRGSDGQRIKIYDSYTIRHSRIMLTLGIAATLWWIWRKSGSSL